MTTTALDPSADITTTHGRPPRIWRSVVRRPLAVAALVYLALVVGASAAASVLAPYDPTSTDLRRILAGPTWAHPLGTDNLGRDVLSRLMYGGQVSLTGVAEAVVTLLVLGVMAGLLAGYAGRWTDRVISWVVDLLLAMPTIVILLVVLSVIGSNETAAMITIGLLGAPHVARVVRGVTLSVRGELYIAAARVAGLTPRQIMLGQVLPRIAGPIIVQASLGAGGALLAQSGIEFLGFGVQPPTPTWGGAVADASTVIDQQPWLLVPSGMTIGLTVLAFGLLGDAVRDSTADRARRIQARRTRRSASRVMGGGGHAAAAPAAEAVLSVRGLTVELPDESGGHPVVEDLDLDIMPGQVIGLLGESGSGKSMVGRAILGLLPSGGRITSGSVWFTGRDLTASGKKLWRTVRGSQIGLISQDPIAALDPAFTVGHQLGELVRRHRGGKRSTARAQVLDLLADVRLPDPDAVARRYPHELSGGMAQRVAIAMALAGGPRLLIADEPTTALDVTVQAEILDLLRNLQQTRGMAVLFISHDWGAVSDLCSQANVMYAGQVVEHGTVADLDGNTSNPYTAGLLACSPQRAAPRTTLRTIAGTVPTPDRWPIGCHFHPRCPLAGPECTTDAIPLLVSAPGHTSRCLHHEDVAKEGEHEPASTSA